VGLLYQLQNNPDQARAAYQRALALDPNAPVAANNLAQLYVDRNENLDVALQLAQTAKAGLPNSHEVDDTLGWIYYKKGDGASAALKRQLPARRRRLPALGALCARRDRQTRARHWKPQSSLAFPAPMTRAESELAAVKPTRSRFPGDHETDSGIGFRFVYLHLFIVYGGTIVHFVATSTSQNCAPSADPLVSPDAGRISSFRRRQ
jgi:hypothetical protein